MLTKTKSINPELKFSFTNYSDFFDHHIYKSIRGYNYLRKDVIEISRYFIEDKTKVIDIGCSQGSLIKDIQEKNDHAKNASYIGLEINDAFQKHWKNETNLNFIVDDVITWQGMNKDVSFISSIFTFLRTYLLLNVFPQTQS